MGSRHNTTDSAAASVRKSGKDKFIVSRVECSSIEVGRRACGLVVDSTRARKDRQNLLRIRRKIHSAYLFEPLRRSWLQGIDGSTDVCSLG